MLNSTFRVESKENKIIQTDTSCNGKVCGLVRTGKQRLHFYFVIVGSFFVVTNVTKQPIFLSSGMGAAAIPEDKVAHTLISMGSIHDDKIK